MRKNNGAFLAAAISGLLCDDVIDTATNKLVATIGAKRTIVGVAVSPDGKRAYVTANGESPGTTSVEVIDTVSNTGVADVPMPTPCAGGGIAITPNGKYAYIGLGGTAVGVFDTSTNSFVAAIPVSGAYLGGIAINPDGKNAYVTTGNNVLVIDTGSNKVVATIPVSGGPRHYER